MGPPHHGGAAACRAPRAIVVVRAQAGLCTAPAAHGVRRGTSAPAVRKRHTTARRAAASRGCARLTVCLVHLLTLLCARQVRQDVALEQLVLAHRQEAAVEQPHCPLEL
ncbi:MAG: hypothetical protein ACK56I_35820, partial [bacterium]